MLGEVMGETSVVKETAILKEMAGGEKGQMSCDEQPHHGLIARIGMTEYDMLTNHKKHVFAIVPQLSMLEGRKEETK